MCRIVCVFLERIHDLNTDMRGVLTVLPHNRFIPTDCLYMLICVFFYFEAIIKCKLYAIHFDTSNETFMSYRMLNVEWPEDFFVCVFAVEQIQENPKEMFKAVKWINYILNTLVPSCSVSFDTYISQHISMNC